MSIQSDNSCDAWDVRKPHYPPRSRLYCLEPVGIGTAYVESLTGYTARLAESHSLLVGVLMSRELAPLIDKAYVTIGASRGLRESFNRATALNGTGIMAMDLVQALETQTLRSDLRLLTLLSWAETIPSRGLFRKHRAWCPACYEEWCVPEQVVYEPLIWALDVVKVCPHHYQPLWNHCPHCHRKLPLLAWHSRAGYCSNCGAWLGAIPCDDVCNHGALSRNEWKYRTWLVDTVGELIAATPHFLSPLPRENIAKSLRIAVDVITKGNIAAFARWIEMPKNTVWLWHAGEVLPQLDVLLRVCYCLGVSLLDFLTQQIIPIEPHQIIGHRPPTRQCIERAPSKPFDSNKVQQALLSALNTQEEPPPTMKKVAEELGYDRRIIFKYFPALCRAIATKSSSYRKTEHARKIKQSCEEVRQIASKLHHENKHPSEVRVSELMTRPGDLRYKKVRLTLQEAQSELDT